MAVPRKTLQEVHREKVARGRAEVAEAIANKSMSVRQMTADERIQADARRSAAVTRQAKRSARASV